MFLQNPLYFIVFIDKIEALDPSGGAQVLVPTHQIGSIIFDGRILEDDFRVDWILCVDGLHYCIWTRLSLKINLNVIKYI